MDGTPNWCPACRSAIVVEPSPMGDAPCPSCGVLLWFYDTPNGRACCRFAAIAPLRDRLFVALAEKLGMRVDEVVQAYVNRETFLPGQDSLDIVEVTMEIEEEFDLTLPLNTMKTLGKFRDLVDYLLRCRL